MNASDRVENHYSVPYLDHWAVVARPLIDTGYTFPLAVARIVEPPVPGRVDPVLAACGIEERLQRDPFLCGVEWLGGAKTNTCNQT